MYGALRLGQGNANGFGNRLGNALSTQKEARLGNRFEQRCVVDPHLQPPPELRLVERAGERDER